jgi:hypothetical protein
MNNLDSEGLTVHKKSDSAVLFGQELNASVLTVDLCVVLIPTLGILDGECGST